jgi:hypothetical protein
MKVEMDTMAEKLYVQIHEIEEELLVEKNNHSSTKHENA